MTFQYSRYGNRISETVFSLWWQILILRLFLFDGVLTLYGASSNASMSKSSAMLFFFCFCFVCFFVYFYLAAIWLIFSSVFCRLQALPMSVYLPSRRVYKKLQRKHDLHTKQQHNCQKGEKKNCVFFSLVQKSPKLVAFYRFRLANQYQIHNNPSLNDWIEIESKRFTWILLRKFIFYFLDHSVIQSTQANGTRTLFHLNSLTTFPFIANALSLAWNACQAFLTQRFQTYSSVAVDFAFNRVAQNRWLDFILVLSYAIGCGFFHQKTNSTSKSI